MNTLHDGAVPRIFDDAHFASDYERYAALLLTRAPRIGRAALHLFADGERRHLLALPERESGANSYRLTTCEFEATSAALAERERELLAMGAYNAPVFRNVETLGAQLALTAMERDLLTLAVIAESLRFLRNAMESLAPHLRDRPALARGLAALLGCEAPAVMQALHPEGTLARTGLVQIDLRNEDGSLLSAREGLAEILYDEFDATQALFSRFAAPARKPALAAADFSHLAADLELLTGLLRSASASREAGVNVLLYGAPGTGKTELARVAAAAADLALHEVRHTSEQGQDLTRARYSQVIIAQRLLRTVSGAVLLFDEAEDLLPADQWSAGRPLGKAAFNYLLETNATPMIWISNEISQIDPAYLRRFAFVLEVKKPSLAVRRRIAARAFGPLAVRDAWIERVAGLEDASPGQITQAARVARLLADHAAVEDTADRVLTHGMRALRQRPPVAHADDIGFDLAYLNCGVDLAAMVRHIAAKPAARLAFYGPPGTGKSALARHIADTAGRPLLLKRASDLLSPWVGECEQNIARAFEQAADEGAVLLLDEADSFLSDRRDARARWELTETNELLTQMERFEGVFVCTTNLVDRIDRAALRRFSAKLHFDYLRPAQARALFVATLQSLDVAVDAAEALAAVGRLNKLTPGDFAAVKQRLRLLGERITAAGFVDALCGELAFKQEGSVQRIGF